MISRKRITSLYTTESLNSNGSSGAVLTCELCGFSIRCSPSGYCSETREALDCLCKNLVSAEDCPLKKISYPSSSSKESIQKTYPRDGSKTIVESTLISLSNSSFPKGKNWKELIGSTLFISGVSFVLAYLMLSILVYLLTKLG